MSVFSLLVIVHVLAELAIGMTVVVPLRQVSLGLAPHQDLSLRRLPSLSPRDGLLVQARS